MTDIFEYNTLLRKSLDELTPEELREIATFKEKRNENGPPTMVDDKDVNVKSLKSFIKEMNESILDDGYPGRDHVQYAFEALVFAVYGLKTDSFWKWFNDNADY